MTTASGSITPRIPSTPRSPFSCKYRLDLDKQLGEGSYGIVFQAMRREDGKIFAAKVLPPAYRMSREGAILKRIRDENIRSVLRFEDAFESFDHYLIITEYLPGKDVCEYIKDVVAGGNTLFSEDLAKSIMKDLLAALIDLYRVKILHRDIKLSNLVFDENSQVKLIDFGFAIDMHEYGHGEACEVTEKKVVGTAMYLAPEVVISPSIYSIKSEVYAAGMTLYQILSGIPPFLKSSLKEIAPLIEKGAYVPLEDEKFSHVSASAKKLIGKMIHLKREKRPSLEEVMADPWFQEESIPSTLEVTIEYEHRIKALSHINAMEKFRKVVHNIISSKPKKGDKFREVVEQAVIMERRQATKVKVRRVLNGIRMVCRWKGLLRRPLSSLSSPASVDDQPTEQDETPMFLLPASPPAALIYDGRHRHHDTAKPLSSSQLQLQPQLLLLPSTAAAADSTANVFAHCPPLQPLHRKPLRSKRIQSRSFDSSGDSAAAAAAGGGGSNSTGASNSSSTSSSGSNGRKKHRLN